MFYFISFASCSSQFIKKVGHTINTIRQCAEEDMNFTILSPWHHDFIIALTEAPAGVPISYAQPIGTSHHPFNMDFPAYRFPTGNAEITVVLKKDQCIGFSYASILRSACMTGITVVVNDTLNHHWDTSARNIDECIFFAPPALIKNFKIDCNMANDKVLVYIHNMILNRVDYSFKGKYNYNASREILNPIIFRLETENDDLKGYANITAYGKTKLMNPLYYSGSISTVKPEDIGVFRHNYAFPIIGCAPAVLLLIVWIYAVLSILRKKPIKNNQIQEPIL